MPDIGYKYSTCLLTNLSKENSNCSYNNHYSTFMLLTQLLLRDFKMQITYISKSKKKILLVNLIIKLFLLLKTRFWSELRIFKICLTGLSNIRFLELILIYLLCSFTKKLMLLVKFLHPLRSQRCLPQVCLLKLGLSGEGKVILLCHVSLIFHWTEVMSKFYGHKL
jgi:hypothetical protein